MACRSLLYRSKMRPNSGLHLNVALYHCSERPHGEEALPSEYYQKTYVKLMKLSHLLKDVDWIDGRLVRINDYSTVTDNQLEHAMHSFKSLTRSYIGGPAAQHALKQDLIASSRDAKCIPPLFFSKPNEREPFIVNSLTKVCNFLNVSAQQRKQLRLMICPQVTQHQVWTGALEETLNALKSDMQSTNHWCPGTGTMMGQQIVLSCLKFLDTLVSYDPDSTSWMRLAPTKVKDSHAFRKWEDVLDMFNDLINCLSNEKELLSHVTKLKAMKEGLAQIRDVLIDKNVGYKETRHQESLVQKKLTKTLGHSSPCLFTLLLYYLYGGVRDIEVELCGGVCGSDGGTKFLLSMGKILTSAEENMVWSGVKQLYRVLGLFKFVWETAGMEGVLELQGHLWCVGTKSNVLTYKGNLFFVHGIHL
ncbi:hypothetical protein RJ640_001119 [Escallonia rubra]|uniref:Uncharacterized protein n=1 Tax=Escallonia rubra TaxID=112253 RepID=A0AA88UVA5_9ASTE|nr:hypothetical protein RJ640_001119 [Escallonia rubra]